MYRGDYNVVHHHIYVAIDSLNPGRALMLALPRAVTMLQGSIFRGTSDNSGELRGRVPAHKAAVAFTGFLSSAVQESVNPLHVSMPTNERILIRDAVMAALNQLNDKDAEPEVNPAAEETPAA